MYRLNMDIPNMTENRVVLEFSEREKLRDFLRLMAKTFAPNQAVVEFAADNALNALDEGEEVEMGEFVFLLVR